MSPLTCDLPVLPRIRKFLRVHYSAPQIDLVSYDPRLAQLWALFQIEKTKDRHPGGWRPKDPRNPDQSVRIRCKQYHPTRDSTLGPLSWREVRTTNILLDAYLYGEFANQARQLAQSGVPPTVAARQFCDKYDFAPDELAEETLKRVWNRQHNISQAELVGFEDGLVNRFFQC